jgi:hypothetical protein
MRVVWNLEDVLLNPVQLGESVLPPLLQLSERPLLLSHHHRLLRDQPLCIRKVHCKNAERFLALLHSKYHQSPLFYDTTSGLKIVVFSSEMVQKL